MDLEKIDDKKLFELKMLAEKVRPMDLMAAFQRYSSKIKILSLDCFDTILWRKAATPIDVFFNLQNKPTFKSLDFTTPLRSSAEARARQVKVFNQESGEVTLRDIYLMPFSNLTEEQLTKLAEEEIEAEIETCYAFPTLVELIRAAHKIGIKIVVVSDTYLVEKQLRYLLEKTLPADAMAAIDTIFCSCEQGKSKTQGVFEKIIKLLNCSPESILHVGDNVVADYIAPRALNINALNLIHQDEYVTDILRLQSTTAKILDHSIWLNQPFYTPFRGILSMNPVPLDKPEALVGYVSLGPVMYAFAHFIQDEIEKLQQAGKRPKVVFLMRDGYLPSLACEALAGREVGRRVRISRFASYAASFRTKEDIDTYLADIGKTNRFRDIARQLLLPEKVSEPLVKAAERSADSSEEFYHLLHRKDIIQIILNKSADYRQRLMAHLKKEVGITAGDTLVLVDLGYSGTAQRRLSGVFADMGIEVVGRYLIALRTSNWQSSRCGLMDPSWCDDNALQTMVFYISILEQLCTSNERSVVDYDKDGLPIYSDIKMSDEQHAKLKLIQAECVRFIHEAKKFFQDANTTLSRSILQQTALAELSRLIYLPMEEELNYLQTFQAEMNLGTTDILRVFDREKGLLGLRRRGMFYMERPSKMTRTNYPAEVRAAGIEYTLSLMVQHRLCLDLKLKDMVMRRESIPVVFMQGQERHVTSIEAISTHDGYFSMWLPGNLQVAIVFGEKYEWVQVDSAEFVEMQAFVKQREAQNTVDASRCLLLDKMIERGGGLFECPSDKGAIIVRPELIPDANERVIRVVFRPVVNRQKQLIQNKPTQGMKVSFTFS